MFYNKGLSLRDAIKDNVFDYMAHTPDCSRYGIGMTTAEIFRDCGLDWGTQENATSSNQQYWMVALLRTLENEGKVYRDSKKKWHVK